MVGKKKHRFPNLACMKISGYYKSGGHDVQLKTDYDNLDKYDKVFISKVFTDTPVDSRILKMDNVEYGGTGFFYDRAPALPHEIEHHMPDYHLYDEYVTEKLAEGKSQTQYKYYTDYSIAYATRGCFRHCPFCVNQNYNRVKLHSPIQEFLDPKRKKICLLDDNFLGYDGWEDILKELKQTGKAFQFKQGLDERLLNDKKCQVLFQDCKYDGDYIFAFDNIEDWEVVERGLKLIRKYTDRICKFYVFCGYDRAGKYDEEFWVQDLKDMFERIGLLREYHCLPYIMRYAKYIESPYQGIYKTVAAWCNQPSFFKKMSLREFCIASLKGTKSRVKYLAQMENDIPEIKKYSDVKWESQ